MKDFDQYSKWLVCVNNQKKMDCIIQNNDKFFFTSYAEKVKYDTALQMSNIQHLATCIPLISEIMAQVLLSEKGGSNNSQSVYINISIRTGVPVL